MREDFEAALARVQSDYDFYISCQSDPTAALAAYSLSAEERATLSSSVLLDDFLKRGNRLISITIKGTHDWVNRVAPGRTEEVDESITREVESLTGASDEDERSEAALKLVQLLG